MSTVGKGQTVSVHYVGTLGDGTEFDSSLSRGEPLVFEVGAGQMIAGFDAALPGMALGEKKNVTVKADDAYGQINPEAFQSIPRTAFDPGLELVVGETVYGEGPNGKPFSAQIDTVGEEKVVLNFNHPLAGQNLNFEIELVSIV